MRSAAAVAIDYRRRRRALLAAARWNAYVASRGLNAEDGRAARRRNQRDMARLRAGVEVRS